MEIEIPILDGFGLFSINVSLNMPRGSRWLQYDIVEFTKVLVGPFLPWAMGSEHGFEKYRRTYLMNNIYLKWQ